MKSILSTEKGVCYSCGLHGNTEEHHIFYGMPDRGNSEKYGLKVYLCPRCHRDNKDGVHGTNEGLRTRLKQEGQRAFEKKHGNHFMGVFGRNYL